MLTPPAPTVKSADAVTAPATDSVGASSPAVHASVPWTDRQTVYSLSESR